MSASVATMQPVCVTLPAQASPGHASALRKRHLERVFGRAGKRGDLRPGSGQHGEKLGTHQTGGTYYTDLLADMKDDAVADTVAVASSWANLQAGRVVQTGVSHAQSPAPGRPALRCGR